MAEDAEQIRMNEEDEEKEYNKAKKNRIVTAGCSIFCHITFLIATIVVLVTDTSSCDYPIRAWLVVYVVLSVFGTLCSLMIEIFLQKKHAKKKTIQICYSWYYALMFLFFVAWTILGSVWVYKDDNCKNSNSYSDFEHGWKLLVAILAINYLLCIICSFAGCVGVLFVISKNYLAKLQSKADQIHNN